MAEKPKKDEAQAQIKKMQRAEDGRRAMIEYEAEALATRAKTERLRALRLGRDAAALSGSRKPVATKTAPGTVAGKASANAKGKKAVRPDVKAAAKPGGL